MSREDSDNFKFGADQVNPDDMLREVPEGNRVARLSRRVTILTIILPLLIGAAIYFLYDDLKKRVVQNQTYGTQSVESLAKTLDTRVQEFSARIAQLETTVAERLAGPEKSVETLKTQLDKTDGNLKTVLGTLKSIETAKADKKEQENLAGQVTALATQTAAREKDMAERLADLTAVTQKEVNDLIRLRTEITALTDNKIDRKTLSQELEKQQQNLAAFSGTLDKKIAAFQNDLRKLERELQQARQTPRPPPAPVNGAGSGIIEKDLDQ
ncbi:MAG: hypothetical protein WAM73_05715 [Desulfobacterales bacterium]